MDRLVYVSRAAKHVGARDAYDIIRTSHNRNARDGLTGALVFLDGWFLQVLEGDAFHLAQRYARIERDPRHEAIDVREHASKVERLFPAEWMALRLDDDVSAAIREQFAYRPGFPAEQFSPNRLIAFIRACHAAAAAPRGVGAVVSPSLEAR